MVWIEDNESINGSQFSRKQCIHIFNLLKDILGEEWLQAEASKDFKSAHPIGAKWKQKGMPNIMQLTTLGLDLEVLQGVIGFDELINNLKDRKKYEAAVYEAHIAALFRRNSKNKCIELYPSSGKRAPDMRVKIRNKWIYIECKKFRASEKQRAFGKLAKVLEERVFDELDQAKKSCDIKIDLPGALTEEHISQIVEIVKEGILRFDGKPLRHNGVPTIRISPVFIQAEGFEYSDNRIVYVSAPVDYSEVKRVRNTFKKAKKQLPEDSPALISMDFTRYQAPDRMFPVIVKREFTQDYNRDISGVLLTWQWTIKRYRKEYILDELYTVSNPRAYNLTPGDLTFRGVGLVGARVIKMSDKLPPPRYSTLAAICKYRALEKGKGYFKMLIPDELYP
ncbi:MAG: hypothetical protein QMC77_00285 [Methanocellales archaeon]|nr:hypothetical protein [Methanocellales archaeon]